MQRNFTHLEAAKDAIDILSNQNLSPLSYDIIFCNLLNLITTSPDPRIFLQSLLEYVSHKNLSNGISGYLNFLTKDSELNRMIQIRKEKNLVHETFSVEEYAEKRRIVLKYEQDCKEFERACNAYQTHGSFKNATPDNRSGQIDSLSNMIIKRFNIFPGQK